MASKEINPDGKQGNKDNELEVVPVSVEKKELELANVVRQLSRMTSMEADATMYESIQGGWTKVLSLVAEPWSFDEKMYDDVVVKLCADIKKVNESKNVKDVVVVGCKRMKELCLEAKREIWEILLDEEIANKDFSMGKVLEAYAPKMEEKLLLLTRELNNE